MKAKDFSEALGQVDKKYVDEAIECPTIRKKRGWIRWVAVAVCVCLAVGGVLVYRTEHPWPRKVEMVVTEQGGEIAMIPHWEDMTIYQQFSEMELNGLRYTVRSGQVPDGLVGDKLADITITGWDEYASMEGEDGRRYCEAEVFSISGISSECAVAVRHEGSDICYSALNSWYRPETLGQFIEDIDLQEHAVFNCVYYDYRKPVSGEKTSIRFDDVGSERIWDMLLATPEAVNEYDDLDFDRPERILGVSVSVPIFGHENISISVREQGYIVTNIMDTGKMFCIGEEQTQAFVDYVLNECEGHEIIYVYTEAQAVPE